MISDRIEDVIENFCKGNKSSFAKKIGVTPSVIGNITGERKGNPSFEVVQKIIDAFALIDANWLLTGRGSMLRDGATNSQNQPSPPPAVKPANSVIPHECIYKELLEKEKAEVKALSKETGRLEAENRQLRKEISELSTIKKNAHSNSKDFASADMVAG